MRPVPVGRAFFAKWEYVGDKIVQPFQAFLALETAGGIALVAMTAVALVWANSGAASLYSDFLHLRLGIVVGEGAFTRDVHFVLNELLMTIFFLVVGLEIKRELLVGELASPRRAALPAIAAMGGVVVPALIYAAINSPGPAERGWGIPMATDIAFVVGALAMLGSRVPQSLAVFLVSVAIVDDLCSVVVIAVFYSAHISFAFLGMAAIGLGVLVLVNLLGFRHPLPYAVVGLVVWGLVYQSGVHATVAGVLIAMTVPQRSRTDACIFADKVQRVFSEFKPSDCSGYVYHLSESNESVVRTLERLCVSVQPPLQRLEHALHPWVAFVIVPLFALGNAGIAVQWHEFLSALASKEGLGIILGLFLGKQTGIFCATWFAVRAGLADLPRDLSFRHVYAGAVLCGIGFTMSLFIADLSFPSRELLDRAKLAVLFGSLVSAVVGLGLLHRFTAEPSAPLREH
jgi:Na+:H+ antiporter, NhaA family